MIKLAYKNGTLIYRLGKRGGMISLGNFEGQQEFEDQINFFVKENRELIDTPIFAFVTFTTQEGKERFGKYNC